MTVGSTSSLVDVLREIALLEPEQLDELTRNILPHFSEPLALAQELIERGWLSGYQAERLLQGHGKDLVVGSYHLVELLGEGNMGQVFKAWHQRLNRVVALKLIRPERLSKDPEAVNRFQREARATAQLLHPNVIIIYDADQIGDRHFIAMEYVDGNDLSKLVKQNGRLPPMEACDYIRQAAEGLQHAHECGLVHRDIKPSNLLVTKPSKRSSGFYPRPTALDLANAGLPPPADLQISRGGLIKILDLGLARLIPFAETRKEDGSLTEEGQMMGTPDYIAPEQARNAHAVDIRADLYSLGCTFYFLLTGQPPFPEGSTIEKLLMHQLNDPRPIVEFQPLVSREVVAIVSKLMAKDPDDRYQTPAEVVDALAEIKIAVTPAPQPAPTASSRAMVNNDEEPTEVTAGMKPLVPRTPVPEAPPEPVRVKQVVVLRGHRGCVLAVAVAPNLELLASGGLDGTVRLWDLNSNPPRSRAVLEPGPGEPQALLFAEDNQTLAVSYSSMVALWDLSEEQPHQFGLVKGPQQFVRGLAFSRSGRLLATGGDRSVCLWELDPTVRKRALLRGNSSHVTAVAFGPDETRPASGSENGTLCLWDTTRLWSKLLCRVPAHVNQVNALSFSPDGTLLATGGLNQTVLLWDLTGPQPAVQAALEGHHNVVRQVRFTGEGKTVVSVSDGVQVILWETATGQKLHEWQLPKTMTLSFDSTRDGWFVAAGNNDGSVVIYQLLVPQEQQ